MMHVVTAFPPPYRQAATEVANKDTNQSVYNEIVSYTSVTRIMSSEHDLML